MKVPKGTFFFSLRHFFVCLREHTAKYVLYTQAETRRLFGDFYESYTANALKVTVNRERLKKYVLLSVYRERSRGVARKKPKKIVLFWV